MRRLFGRFALMAALWLVAGSALAQDLRLVTVTRTPFSLIQNGAETGFSIDLWAAIAAELGVGYEVERLSSFGEMLDRIESGAADIAAANISITADRETRMDFSQPIFSSGLRVMVPADSEAVSILPVILSRDLLLAVVAAFALLFGGGMLMWRLERNAQEYFQGSAREKAFPSFWWALNLVVNGGFEERQPRTTLGRIFGTLLVVSSLFIVSIFVAKITSAMTVNAIQSSVESINDLYDKTVGTTEGSTAAAYLTGRELEFTGYPGLDELLRAFEAGDIDAVVFDAPILAYYVATEGAGIGDLVGPTFLREYYGFALPSGSPLREQIDRVLLRFAEDGTYRELHLKWFGEAEAG